MTSVSYLEDDKNEGTLQLEDDPWIKHLNALWDTCLEQCEPSTDDRLLHINLGTKENPRLILISESLTPLKREELFRLIWEYINVFAWSFEDMPGLNPQVVMHQLNINPKVKPEQPQRRYCLVIMKIVESKVKKLIDSGSEKRNIQIG